METPLFHATQMLCRKARPSQWQGELDVFFLFQSSLFLFELVDLFIGKMRDQVNGSGQRLHPPNPAPCPQQPGNAGLRLGTERGPPTGRSAADSVASLQGTHHHSSLYKGQRPQTPCSYQQACCPCVLSGPSWTGVGTRWAEDAPWHKGIQPGLQGPCKGQQVNLCPHPSAGPETRQDPRNTAVTMLSTGLGSPQYHTHLMMKGFLKHHSQILSLRKASAVPSAYAQEDPTHLRGAGGPETAGNTAEDATNHRGWRDTPRSGHSAGRGGASSPKLWGHHRPLTKYHHFTPTWMATSKETENPKCWQGCGETGSLMHH